MQNSFTRAPPKVSLSWAQTLKFSLSSNYCKAFVSSSTLHQGESPTLHSADNTAETTPSFTVTQWKSLRHVVTDNQQAYNHKLEMH